MVRDGAGSATARDLVSASGLGFRIVDASAGQSRATSGELLVGVSRDAHGAPDIDCGVFDILLSTWPDAPAPWVHAPANALAALTASMERNTALNPIAATIAAQVLRAGENLPFGDALTIESLAYSALLGGEEFQVWLEERGPRPPGKAGEVAYTRKGERLVIELRRSHARNAINAQMRDDLHAVLEAAHFDPDGREIVLRGDGPDFCAGGDLAEFGTARDLSLAHLIRTFRAPVQRVHDMRERVTAVVHGAVVGAGAEIAAAAGKVIARPDARFWLPEIPMGLIPGAGGTVSIARRIGRHRTLLLALSGWRLDAQHAVAWGLADIVGEPTWEP